MNIGILIHHSSLIKAVHPLIEQMGHRAVLMSQDPEVLEHLLDGSSPTEIDLLLMESDVFSLASDIQLIHELSSSSPSVPLLLLVDQDRQKGIQEAFPHMDLLVKPFRFAELQAALQRIAPSVQESQRRFIPREPQDVPHL
jgi:DNA-binding NtrC family response regulator